MSVIKSFSVGNGDMFYIKHESDNFTIIDCNMDDTNKERIVSEIQEAKNEKIKTIPIVKNLIQDFETLKQKIADYAFH